MGVIYHQDILKVSKKNMINLHLEYSAGVKCYRPICKQENLQNFNQKEVLLANCIYVYIFFFSSRFEIYEPGRTGPGMEGRKLAR